MTNVLFISRQRIVGRTNGSSTYLLDLAQAVRDAGMTPHLIQPAPSMLGRVPVLRLRPEMKVFASHRVRGVFHVGSAIISYDWRVYASATRAILAAAARRMGVRETWSQDRPAPYAISIPWTDADRRYLARHTNGTCDVVIADYMFQAEGFESVGGNKVPTAIVMHDMFSARDAGGRDSVISIDKQTEFALLNRGDRIIAIQASEAAIVDAELGVGRSIVAPMAAYPVGAPQIGDKDRLLFVGSNTAPNVVGLEWFFAQVWPSVRRSCPEAHLQIAGTVARAFPDGGPEGATFLGLVDDLEVLYGSAGIVISPLTFGSGLKVKLIEALAAGKAIVATSITLQGVEDECSKAVAVANDPEDFANAIIGLHSHSDHRASLAAAALAAAREHFSVKACYGALIDWLNVVTLAKQDRL